VQAHLAARSPVAAIRIAGPRQHVGGCRRKARARRNPPLRGGLRRRGGLGRPDRRRCGLGHDGRLYLEVPPLLRQGPQKEPKEQGAEDPREDAEEKRAVASHRGAVYAAAPRIVVAQMLSGPGGAPWGSPGIPGYLRAVTTQAPLPALVDSHCHLTWPSFDDDRDEVVARMHEAGVEQAIVIATTLEDARRAAGICDAHPGLYPTVGIHPNDLPEDLETDLDALEAMLLDGGFIAVGETGLDYYRDDTDPAAQQVSFRRHCELAVRTDLPVIVHIRDREGRVQAYDDVAEIIEAHPGLRGVIHCYTGDPEHAQRYLAAGFVISFSGILTFPKGGNVRESAAVVPIERTLVETDAPFLAPVPKRGKRNEPAFVVHTARALAELHGLSEADVRRITTRNTRSLFRLPTEETAGPATYTIRDAIYVNVTNACDAKCVFCPRTHDDFEVKGYDLRRPKDPRTEEILEAIGDPKQWSEVVFCGFG